MGVSVALTIGLGVVVGAGVGVIVKVAVKMGERVSVVGATGLVTIFVGVAGSVGRKMYWITKVTGISNNSPMSRKIYAELRFFSQTQILASRIRQRNERYFFGEWLKA